MNTVKDSLLILEHYPDTEIYVFYMDIRAFGKGFEDLLRRSKESGVHYIRGFPGEIKEDPQTRDLTLKVENTTSPWKNTTWIWWSFLWDWNPGADLKQLATSIEPLPDRGRLSHGSTSQTEAGGRADARHLLCRDTRSPRNRSTTTP